MASVGLAQNFSAIKALSTEGIQKGHMSLHARSVAVTAGAPKEIFETVVRHLIDRGEITVAVARDIIAELTSKNLKNGIKKKASTTATANGKVILLGEHAVVYGKPAIAVPIKNAVVAEVTDTDHLPEIKVPAWDIDDKLEESNTVWWNAIQSVFQEMGVAKRKFSIHIKPNIPAAMGLGGSAATAVAIVRSVSKHFNLLLNNDEVNHYAFLCEKAAHGTPSGIDNTIATYGLPLVYRVGEKPKLEMIEFPKPLNLVIGISGQPSLTLDMVSGVRERWKKNTNLYESLFTNFAKVAESGLDALKNGDYKGLGHMMTMNHGLLNAIQVSSPALDRMVQISRDHGALGAKLTGAGGGGSIIALCDDNSEGIINGLTRHGFKALQVAV
jgi:hydroxymethylglutaryl-CoA reductase